MLHEADKWGDRWRVDVAIQRQNRRVMVRTIWIMGRGDEATALVEFSDDEGCAYAIVPCPREALLILRTAPLAA